MPTIFIFTKPNYFIHSFVRSFVRAFIHSFNRLTTYANSIDPSIHLAPKEPSNRSFLACLLPSSICFCALHVHVYIQYWDGYTCKNEQSEFLFFKHGGEKLYLFKCEHFVLLLYEKSGLQSYKYRNFMPRLKLDFTLFLLS